MPAHEYRAEVRIWSEIGHCPITKRDGAYYDELAIVQLSVVGPVEAFNRTVELIKAIPHGHSGHFTIVDYPNQNTRSGWVNTRDSVRALFDSGHDIAFLASQGR